MGRRDYSAFGVPSSVERDADLQPRFSGLFFDLESQLYLAKTRGYVPDLEGFLQPDPQRRAGGSASDGGPTPRRHSCPRNGTGDLERPTDRFIRKGGLRDDPIPRHRDLRANTDRPAVAHRTHRDTSTVVRCGQEGATAGVRRTQRRDRQPASVGVSSHCECIHSDEVRRATAGPA